MLTKKQIIISIIILFLLIISGLFITNKIVKDNNRVYCSNFEFGENCPEDRCYSGYCPINRFLGGPQSVCCPNGLFNV